MTDTTDTTDELQGEAETTDSTRRTVSWLIIVATILALFSTLNVWVERELLDTDEWVEVSDELLADDDVRALLASYIVDELYASVDLGEDLENRLPDNLDPLAGLISAALRAPATEGVDRLLATEGVRTTWTELNRTLHETLVRILRDETRPGVSTADGAVTLELRELVETAGLEFGLSEQALDRLPEDAGRITIVESDELETAQSLVRLVEILSVVLFFAVVGLYAAAVYLGEGRRIDVLRSVGTAVLFASGIILVGRRIAARAASNAVADTPQTRQVAGVVTRIGTQLLRDMAIGGIAIGLLIIGFALLLGRSERARRARALVTPLLLTKPLTAWLTAGAILLIVLFWLPSEPLETWWRGAVFIGLFAVGLEALRRQLRHEHDSNRDAP